MLFKNVLLQGSEAVCNGAQTRTLDIGGVVTGTTAIVVLTLLNAVIDIETQERSRSVEREHPLDIVVHREFQVDEVLHLPVPGIVELFVGLEAAGITCLESEFLARLWIDAVMECNLQDLRCIQIACQQIGLLAKSTDFDAARTASLAGILHRLPCPYHLLHISVWIEDGWIAVTLTNHLDTFQQEVVGGVLCDMYRQSRLQLMQFLLDFQNHIGEFVGSTLTVAVHAADIDIGEVVIGAAFESRHAHLWRRRLVVELDPQATEQFLGLLAGQRTFLDAFLIEGPQVLVDVSRVHRVPAVELRHRSQMHEPVHLYRLPQIPRCVGRHPPAHLGYLLQFAYALLVGLRLFTFHF